MFPLAMYVCASVLWPWGGGGGGDSTGSDIMVALDEGKGPHWKAHKI